MTDWVWLDEAVALAVHDLSINLYGGAPGVRDEVLLKSALEAAMQRAVACDHTDAVEAAAAYTSTIIGAFPFVEGNLRTGFLLGAMLLELNGWRLTAGEDDVTQAVQHLASGLLDEAGYTEFLRANVVAKGE